VCWCQQRDRLPPPQLKVSVPLVRVVRVVVVVRVRVLLLM
jgi:hypothetical protein